MATSEKESAADWEAQIVARMESLRSPTTAEIRALRREFSRQLAKTSASVIFKVAERLLDRRSFPYRFVAYELVQHNRGARQSLNARKLKRLGKGMESWAAVDTFASYLSGPAWREQQISDDLIHRWARAKDRWWRRAALVSSVPLNNKARGGHGDAQRTLQVCQMLVADRDDMIVKALSWSLRELAKRDPDAVAGFLSSNKHLLAPPVLREVGNKLRTGLKNPRK